MYKYYNIHWIQKFKKKLYFCFKVSTAKPRRDIDSHLFAPSPKDAHAEYLSKVFYGFDILSSSFTLFLFSEDKS